MSNEVCRVRWLVRSATAELAILHGPCSAHPMHAAGDDGTPGISEPHRGREFRRRYLDAKLRDMPPATDQNAAACRCVVKSIASQVSQDALQQSCVTHDRRGSRSDAQFNAAPAPRFRRCRVAVWKQHLHIHSTRVRPIDLS
jgi:hypothetical protein